MNANDPHAAPTPPQRPVSTHSLPGWFTAYQDNIGLSILVVALMGINGVVYGSGVIRDIMQPTTWGIFGTLLFVLFFAAGTVMPGLALRFGVGIFVGSWGRRFLCLLFTLVYFAVEVWASITERSLNTVTTPADRWLVQALGVPAVPFSPTVLAISLSLSLAVVGWGIVVTPPHVEDVATVEAQETLRTIRARARAERLAIEGAGLAGSVYAARQALAGRSPVPPPVDAAPTVPSPIVEPTPIRGRMGDRAPTRRVLVNGTDNALAMRMAGVPTIHARMPVIPRIASA